MKFKALMNQGTITYGLIVDGTYTKLTNTAFAFDSMGAGWWFYGGQWEPVEEQTSENSGAKSLRELIGQDVAKLEVVFK